MVVVVRRTPKRARPSPSKEGFEMSDLVSNNGAARSEARSPKAAQTHEDGRAAILSEQLEYLLMHTGSCSKGCPDCARMRRVEDVLLQPFRVEVYSPLLPAA